MKKLFLFSALLFTVQMYAQNIGINTTSPDYALHVVQNNAGIVQSNADKSASLGMWMNIAPAAVYGWMGTITNQPFRIGSQSNHISILNNGKIGMGVGVQNPSSAALLEVGGQVKINGGSPGAGKILVTDANGLARWANATKYTSITPPSCQKLANATTTYAKIADLGTFTKDNAETKIELTFQSHLYFVSLNSNGLGVRYELRIDDLPTITGSARAMLRVPLVFQNTSIFGLFTGLSTGIHTVSIWAQCAGTIEPATATDVFYDPGCWSSTNLNVKETF
jgi:hypothetical protein